MAASARQNDSPKGASQWTSLGVIAAVAVFAFPEGSTTYRVVADLGLVIPAQVYVNSRRKPAAKVSGNAGCGKSARPV